MNPSDCAQCQMLFLANPLLQQEMRHHAVKYGTSSAISELNDSFSEQHLEHENAYAKLPDSFKPTSLPQEGTT